MTIPHLPQWLLNAAKVVVCVGIAVLLVRTVDGWQALEMLRTANPVWLIAAAASLTIQTVLSAIRWRITAQQLGIDIPVPSAIREYYLSQVVNQSLPGGVVGDANRAVRARGQAGLVASGQAVVFERLAGQIGLLTLLAFGLLLTALSANAPDWPGWIITPTLTALGIVTCLLVGVGWRTRMPSNTTSRAFTKALFAPEVRLIQISLSLTTALCNIAAFAFCAAALGEPLAPATALTLIPLILFAMVIPLSISGWGLREGAAAVLFPIVGATSEAGLATSVAFGLVFLATVVPGLLVTWLRPNAPVSAQR